MMLFMPPHLPRRASTMARIKRPRLVDRLATDADDARGQSVFLTGESGFGLAINGSIRSSLRQPALRSSIEGQEASGLSH
jgi:hypothetical protein